jgi:hypothetical protein
MILNIEFKILIDDETLREDLYYRLYRRTVGEGESWSSWQKVEKTLSLYGK